MCLGSSLGSRAGSGAGCCALQLEPPTMSEEHGRATAGKNFRSSYYKSLGFKGDEKLLSQLEGLIKADPIGKTRFACVVLFNEPLPFFGLYIQACISPLQTWKNYELSV